MGGFAFVCVCVCVCVYMWICVCVCACVMSHSLSFTLAHPRSHSRTPNFTCILSLTPLGTYDFVLFLGIGLYTATGMLDVCV